MAKPSKRPVDMLLSLAVIVVPLLLISWFFTKPTQTQVKAVDWQPILTAARSEAHYPVLAPTGLPDTWVVTKADWLKTGQPGLNGEPALGNTWQFGALSPDGTYYWLVQRDSQGDSLVTQQTKGGYADGSSTINGVTWLRFTSPDGRTRALVQRSGTVATVVTADVPYAGVEAFVSTLSS